MLLIRLNLLSLEWTFEYILVFSDSFFIQYLTGKKTISKNKNDRDL